MVYGSTIWILNVVKRFYVAKAKNVKSNISNTQKHLDWWGHPLMSDSCTPGAQGFRAVEDMILPVGGGDG